MQVNLDLNTKHQTQFTAIYKDKNVSSYLFRKLSPNDSIEYRYIDIESDKIPVPMHLSTIKDFFGRERLLVKVGDKQIKESLFKSAIRVMKEGLEYSRDIHEQEKLTSNMNIPHIQ